MKRGLLTAVALLVLGAESAHAMSCMVDLMKRDGEALSSPYGVKRRNGSPGWHQGLDIVNGLRGGAVTGNPIYAGHAGKTTWRPSGSGGNWVAVQSADKTYNTVYIHLANTDFAKMAEGKPQVQAGETIGYMGNTGASFVHLHLGMTVRGDQLSGAGMNSRIMHTAGCPTCGTKQRDPLSAEQIRSAASNSYYFVNPEPFLSHQIPVQPGLAGRYPEVFGSRADPTKTLPTTCTVDNETLVASAPASVGTGASVSDGTAGLAAYRSAGADFATTEASSDTRSVYLNLARIGADEVRSASAATSPSSYRDLAMAQLLVLQKETR